MRITISFELENVKADDSLASLISGALGGEPIRTKKARKPRPPMSDAEKKAFRAKMVAGQEAAAKAKAKAAKKPSKKKAATKSKS